jgi:hypothetical protein
VVCFIGVKNRIFISEYGRPVEIRWQMVYRSYLVTERNIAYNMDSLHRWH